MKIRQDRFAGHDTRGGRSYHSNKVDGNDKRNKKCEVYEDIHPIWRCSTFKMKSLDKKWHLAKKFGLCYRCFGDDYLGNACKRSKSCSISIGKENHHYLLHREKSPFLRSKTKEEENKEKENKEEDKKTDKGSGCDTEGDRQSMSYGATQGQETKLIALRTVPVILKNGERKIHLDYLLDEGSDTTYVNEDVVEALGLQGSKTKIELKDKRKDGMKPVNWIKRKHNREHLSTIHSPKRAPGRSIDILLGADHHEFMYAMKEIPGKLSQLSARLCPMGWTAVFKLEMTARIDQHHTAFHHTYRIDQESATIGSQQDEDHSLIDLESIDVTPVNLSTSEMSPNEKLA